MREYPYKIALRMYDFTSETHYIHASNHRDAFSKAHRFSNPIAMSGKHGGVQFIYIQKLTKAYCEQHGVVFDD